MELDEAVRRRRMVRSFAGRPVPDDVVGRLIAGALRAPTAGNTSGTAWVVLEGPQTRAYWDAVTTAAWRGRSRRWAGLSRAPVVAVALVSPRAYVSRYAEADKVAKRREPAGAAATGGPPGPRGHIPASSRGNIPPVRFPMSPGSPPGTAVDREGAPEEDALGGGLTLGGGEGAWPVPYWWGDAAFGVMTLLLGATAEGLGACFLGVFRGEAALLEALGVPEGWRVFGAVAIGHPDGNDHPSASLGRRGPPASERLHWGGWGGPRT